MKVIQDYKDIFIHFKKLYQKRVDLEDKVKSYFNILTSLEIKYNKFFL